MSNSVNPYRAGRPVEGPEMFFGRDDALIWLERQLTLNRRLIIVYGPDLIGKTSLVHRLPTFLESHVCWLYFGCKPHQGKSLPQVLAVLAGELAEQLMALDLVAPHQVDTAADSATAVQSLLRQADLALDAGASPPTDPRRQRVTNNLLLVIDDVHQLVENDDLSVTGFLDSLATLLAEVPSLHLLLTLSDLYYEQHTHPLLSGAVSFRLGPFKSDAAQQLITRPAQGALRFDSGVVKRISDITSNHPYYIHLFCYTLYNCCAQEGWINQSDVDRVLEKLLALPNERFQAIWDQSNWAEKATLTALAGLRGAHGPIMRQEVVNHLKRFDLDVEAEVILDALEALANRGILVRMGALSYRFAVNLFRYWLDRHTDPVRVLARADWNQLSAQLAMRASTEGEETEDFPLASGEKQDAKGRRWSLGRLSILGLTGTALIGIALLAIAFSGVLPPETIAPTPAPAPTQAPRSFVSPVPSSTSTPVPTPTPTRPLVVAHSLPAIVYMAQGATDGIPPSNWEIFVMDASGANRQQRTEGNFDNITPVWSTDGQHIAFVSQRDGNREIYVIPAGKSMTSDTADWVNITQHPAEDWTPAWSPDGQQIAFSSNRQGNWEVFIVNADGTDLRQVSNDGYGNLSPVWSPDAQTMAYANKRDGDWEIYTMPAPDIEGQVTGERRRLTFSDGNDLSPIFSPQGDRIAFESNREGNVEIYVMNTDGSNQRNLSNSSFSDEHGPIWSSDGQRLLFYSNRGGNWDLFVMTANGENVVNLTNTPDIDEQAPAWRP